MKFSLTTAAILALLATDLKAQSPAAIDPPTQIPPVQNAPTQNFSKHIAIIEGDKSRGSGFIAIYQENPSFSPTLMSSQAIPKCPRDC